MIEAITAFDMSILHWIQEVLRSDFMDQAMTFITKLGDAGFLWIVLGLLLVALPKTRRWGVALLVSLAIAALVGNLIIKPLVGRLRPCDVETTFQLLIPHPGKTSFPSGHAISSFASATALFLYSKKWGIPALILAVGIAFSRCYLFVHYPTDVLVGAVLGILTALLVKWAFEKYFPNLWKPHEKETAV